MSYYSKTVNKKLAYHKFYGEWTPLKGLFFDPSKRIDGRIELITTQIERHINEQ